jgi:hypothetical protein
MIQSMLFLKLIVAGHSTLYITRTEGWFWQRPYPAPLLLAATTGTEILGTLVAVYGFLITPAAGNMPCGCGAMHWSSSCSTISPGCGYFTGCVCVIPEAMYVSCPGLCGMQPAGMPIR